MAIGIPPKSVSEALRSSVLEARIERTAIDGRTKFRAADGVQERPLERKLPGMLARVWTLETVRQRCDEIGECWIWKQAVQSKGYPQASINGKTGQSVRLYVYSVLLGKTRRRTDAVTAKCNQILCCSPTCLVAKSRGAVIRRQYELGSRSRQPKLGIGCINPKLTREQVDAIRALPSGESQASIGRRYGVAARTIGKILNGESWAPKRQPESVFNWRPA
jgi:hypothetical protein